MRCRASRRRRRPLLRWWRTGPSRFSISVPLAFRLQLRDEAFEGAATMLEIVELIEAGAGGGQEDGVAGAGGGVGVAYGSIDGFGIHQRNGAPDLIANFGSCRANQQRGARFFGQRLAQEGVIAAF